MKQTIRTQRLEKCQVAEILSEPKRLTEINYEQKNYQQLKQAQSENRQKKIDASTRPPKDPFKIKRFQNIGSLVFKNPADLKPKKAKDRSSSADQPIIVTYSPDDQGVVEAKQDLKKDYIKENAKATIFSSLNKIQDSQVQPLKGSNPNYGKVPGYLEEFKAKREEVLDKKRADEEQAKCPPGMKLMPEHERLETLSILQKGKEEVWQSINKLPIASNTLSVQRRRAEYEAKLLEVENAIKTFSRQKVYVALS